MADKLVILVICYALAGACSQGCSKRAEPPVWLGSKLPIETKGWSISGLQPGPASPVVQSWGVLNQAGYYDIRWKDRRLALSLNGSQITDIEVASGNCSVEFNGKTIFGSGDTWNRIEQSIVGHNQIIENGEALLQDTSQNLLRLSITPHGTIARVVLSKRTN